MKALTGRDSFLPWKAGVRGNNEMCIKEVSERAARYYLIFVATRSKLEILTRKVLFKHKISVLYLYSLVYKLYLEIS